MKKTVFLFSIIFLMTLSLVSGVTLTPTTQSVGTDFDGSIAFDDGEEYFYMLRGYPQGYLYVYDTSFSTVDSTTINTYENYITTTDNYIYTIQWSSSSSDTLKRYYKNYTFIDSTIINFENDIVSLTNKDNQIYALGRSGTVYVYDENIDYVTSYDVCINVGDCPLESDSLTSLSSLSYDETNKIFYYWNSYSYYLYILDENLNDITEEELIIEPPSNSFSELTVYNNSLYGKGKNTNNLLYIYTLPPPPEPPSYNTILNTETGEYINYSKQYCVNDFTYCNNTKYVLDSNDEPQFYCESGNSEYCSSECKTLYNNENNMYYGVCEQLACTNECQIEGFTTCTTQNSYAICGQYDSDACLEYSNDLYCPSDYTCSDSEIGHQCVDREYTTGDRDTWTQGRLNVATQYTSSTIEPYKEELVEERTPQYDVLTTWFLKAIDSVYIQKYNVTKEIDYSQKTNVIDAVSNINQEYTALSCDYQEELLINDQLSHNDLLGNKWDTTGTIQNEDSVYYLDITNTTANKTLQTDDINRIETIIEFSESGEYYIRLHNEGGIVNELKFDFNNTESNIVITETTNNKTIVNNTGLQEFNDLKYIGLKILLNKEINTVTYEIQINRQPASVIITDYSYSLPLSYSSGLNNPNIIEYSSNNGDMKIYKVGQWSINRLPPYKNTLETRDNINTCTLNDDGCQDIRIYGNEKPIPTYHFYDTARVCVESGVVQQPDDDEVVYEDLDFIEQIIKRPLEKSEKLGLATVLIGFLFVVGYLSSVGTDGAKYAVITSSVVILFAVIGFAFMGYIPLWIIGLIILVGVFAIRSIFMNGMFGGRD